MIISGLLIIMMRYRFLSLHKQKLQDKLLIVWAFTTLKLACLMLLPILENVTNVLFKKKAIKKDTGCLLTFLQVILYHPCPHPHHPRELSEAWGYRRLSPYRRPVAGCHLGRPRRHCLERHKLSIPPTCSVA